MRTTHYGGHLGSLNIARAGHGNLIKETIIDGGAHDGPPSVGHGHLQQATYSAIGH